MSCQAALPLGAQAANTVLSRIAGTEPAVLNQAFTGQCVSLGRAGGTIQIAHSDDRVTRFYIVVAPRRRSRRRCARARSGPSAEGPQTGFVLLAQGRWAGREARRVEGDRSRRPATSGAVE